MRKLILLAGIAAAGAAVAKKLGQGSEPTWHDTGSSGGPAAPPVSAVDTDDAGAAAPDEAIADAIEEPHPVTSPDAPLTESELERPLEVTADDIDPEAKPE